MCQFDKRSTELPRTSLENRINDFKNPKLPGCQWQVHNSENLSSRKKSYEQDPKNHQK